MFLNNIIYNLKNDKFIQGTIFLTAVNFLGSFFNYLVHPIVARSLSVWEYGDFQAILSFVTIIGIFSVVIMTSVTKEAANLKSKNKLNEVINFQITIIKKLFILGLIIFIAVFILSFPIKIFLKISSLASIIISSTLFLYYFVLMVNNGILNGLQEFSALAINRFLEPFTRFLFVLFFVFIFGWGIVGASMAIALTGILAFLYGFYQIKKLNLPKVNRKKYDLKFLFNYSFIALFFLLANQFFYNLDMLYVKASLGADEAGFYGALLTIGRIIYFIGGAVPLVMFPVVAEQIKDKSLRKYFTLLKSLLVTLILVAPVVLAITIFPELIIKILIGEKFLPIAKYLPIFTLPMVLLTVINILSRYFLALEQKKIGLFLIFGVLIELVVLYFNNGSIYAIINSVIFSFSLITLVLFGWLGICYKRDKKLVLKNL